MLDSRCWILIPDAVFGALGSVLDVRWSRADDHVFVGFHKLFFTGETVAGPM